MSKQIGKLSFSDKGFKAFESKTRKEQKEYLKKKLPLMVNYDKLLKDVKYAKRKRAYKKVSEDKQSESDTKGGGKDNNERPNDN